MRASGGAVGRHMGRRMIPGLGKLVVGRGAQGLGRRDGRIDLARNAAPAPADCAWLLGPWPRPCCANRMARTPRAAAPRRRCPLPRSRSGERIALPDQAGQFGQRIAAADHRVTRPAHSHGAPARSIGRIAKCCRPPYSIPSRVLASCSVGSGTDSLNSGRLRPTAPSEINASHRAPRHRANLAPRPEL